MKITQEVIDKKIILLKSSKEKFFELYQEMGRADGGKMFPLDLLATGIINRSLLVISGFLLLLENKNFISAAPLIRLHLDNLLHFYAAFIVKEPHKYSEDKIKGKHTRELKDKNGMKMTDSYLVKVFCSDPNNKEFFQLENIYKEVSGFIHFSDKHIFSSFTGINNKQATIRLSDRIENISLESENEAIETMILITRGIFKYFISWIHTKNNPKK